MNIDMKKERGRETQREKKRGDAGRRGGWRIVFQGRQEIEK